MKIAVIGATGFVGKAVVNELLDRGHTVLALARNISVLERIDDHLIKSNVDVMDVDFLAVTLRGYDAVVSAFNGGWNNKNQYEDTLNGAHAIHKALKLSGVKKYIFIGGAGSLEIEGKQLVDLDDFPDKIKAGAKAVRDYLNFLKTETDLNWSFFSPAIEMFNGGVSGRTGNYRLGTKAPVFNKEGRSILSVEDLAVVIVDELELNQQHRSHFTAAY